MKMSHLAYGSLSVALALLSSPILAKDIPCPTIDLVQKSIGTIDTITLVDKSKGEYDVFSSEEGIFTEASNLWWSLGSVGVKNALDFNTAFFVGLSNVKHAYKLRHVNAQEYPFGFFCTYLDKNGNTSAIAFSEKHEASATKFKKALKITA